METVGKQKANYMIYPGLNTSTAHHLINSICMFLDVKVEDLSSDKREMRLVTARSYYFYISRNLIGDTSLKKLGRKFNRDHSTVIHSLQTFQNDLQTNEVVAYQFERFLKETNKDWHLLYTKEK